MISYGGWTSEPEVQEDQIAPWPARALAATLGREVPGPGDRLPLGWHWLYFLVAAPQDGLGPDGHPARGGFLPPVDLPRRMYAGGTLRCLEPLHVGDQATRTSQVTAMENKEGKTGNLVFVTVRHDIRSGDRLCIEEEQNLVYREAEAPNSPPRPAPVDAIWSRRVQPDPVLLFRYSALTFNGHRIHYDSPYVRNVEGYRDLVVHGPLMALLLLDLLQRERSEQGEPREFRFRGIRPVFADAPFHVEGRPSPDGTEEVWIRDPEGRLAMRGRTL